MGVVSADRVDGLPLALRRRLAAMWLDDATAEHASVASFARATLELLAVGAPPELVFAAQQASLDEVRHAQTCFTLAALYSGEAAEPGPLPVPTLRSPDLMSLACDTFVEGCIGETLAALAALRAARHCQIPAVREALTGIADDEARHAELAWATLAYAVRNGGPEVAAAVRALAEPLRAAAMAADDMTDATDANELPTALLLAHGRLPAAAMAATRRDAWLEVLGPTLDPVLGTTAERLIERLPCAALVVRQRARTPYRTLLACVDTSPAAIEALRRAMALAPVARVHVVHAHELPLSATLRRLRLHAQATAHLSAERTRVRAALEAALTDAGIDMRRVKLTLRSGPPSRVIERAAARLAPDLIAVGHSAALLDRFFLGSIARHVLRIDIGDVLVTRAG